MDDGDRRKSIKRETLKLEPICPLRNSVTSAQRRLTRAFVRDVNIEVLDIPDTGQPVVWPEQRTDAHTITDVESNQTGS